MKSELEACESGWQTTHDKAVSKGVRDGEARRLADEARRACEDPILERGYALVDEATAHPSCLGLQVSSTKVPPAKKTGGQIRLLCDTVDGTKLFTRPGRTFDDPAALVQDFLKNGPNDAEKSQGFGAAQRASIEATDVKLQADGLMVIDLAADFGSLGDSLYWLATFDVELGANAFQFEQVDRIQVTLNGSCEDLWSGVYRECHMISRSAYEQLSGELLA